LKRFLIVLLSAASCASPDADDSAIAARVNGEVITVAALESKVCPLRPGLVTPELRLAVLRECVQERLIAQSASKNRVSFSEEELTLFMIQSVERPSAPFPACKGCSRLIPTAEYREACRTELLAQKLIHFFIQRNLLKPEEDSEDRVRRFFEDHRDQYRGDFETNRPALLRCFETQSRAAQYRSLIDILLRQAIVSPEELAVQE